MKTSRRTFLHKTTRNGLALLSTGSLASEAVLDPKTPNNALLPTAPLKPDHVVRSLPENMVWGYFGADVPPVYKVNDGDVVEIQTVNPSGVSRTNPEEFYTKNNLPLDQHAQEVIAIMKNVKPEPSGIRGHMLTGPVYIDGAQPGDSLEIRILDLTFPAGFGVNSVWPGGGGIPDEVKTRETFVYRYDAKRKTGSLKEGVDIPLKPFMGVMALSPPADMGRQSSIPPGFLAAIWILSI